MYGYGGVEPETCACFGATCVELAAAASPGGWIGKFNHGVFNGDALISRARSKIATHALEAGFDLTLMCDHDLTSNPGDASAILRACWDNKNIGVLAACVPKRGFGGGIASRPAEMGEYQTGTDKIIRATDVGGAYTVYKTDMFRKLASDMKKVISNDMEFYPFFSTETVENEDGTIEYLSEDWALARRAMKGGYECAIYLKPMISHIGKWTFTMEDAFRTLPVNNVAGGNVAPTSAIIYCAGAGERWDKERKELKQLIEINGETILARTVRQLKARNVKHIDIIAHDNRLRVDGCGFVNPPKREYLVDTILSTSKLWEPPQIAIFGDVWFSDDAMDYICKNCGDLAFFGRADVSKTHGGCGEIFGFSIGERDKLYQALNVGRKDAVTNPSKTLAGSIWQPYRYLIGQPLDRHIVHKGQKLWREIDDATDDFDSHQRLHQWKRVYCERSCCKLWHLENLSW
jgi:hypothetical protein